MGKDGSARLVDGRYQVVAALGEGGMAAVFRAWDTRLRAWRALKFLLPQYAEKPSIRRRFEAEAHAMARIDHPNVVRVYDVGVSGVLPYIAMELVEAGSLDGWIARLGRMPARLAVSAIVQACEGISAAHACGIVHRDVKPQNILIDRRGICKIGDFGIARIDDSSGVRTKAGAAMGTLGFMSPEQRNDASSIDGRTDVYSLAMTLYTLLTGGERQVDLFASDEAELVQDEIPAPLVPILLRASAYKRENRFPSVDAFADALRATVRALPPGPPRTTLLSGIETDAAGDDTPLPAEVELPAGALPGEPPHAPAPGEARSAKTPPVLPYRMPVPNQPSSRRATSSGSLPSYVAEGGVPARPEGFAVGLTPEDRAAVAAAKSRAPAAARPPAAPADQSPPTADRSDLVGAAGEFASSILRALMRPLSVLGTSAVVLFVLWIGFAWTATGPVREAAANAHDAETRLYVSLEQVEPPMTAELAELGAPTDPIQVLFRAWEDEKEPSPRLIAAGRLLEALDAAVTERKKALPSTVAYRISRLEEQLATVHAISETHQKAMIAWETAADAPGARGGIWLGFAPKPY